MAESQMPDPSQCIFCKIIKGEINSLKVYEDPQCIAILDINPATKGHLLLIPKEHFQLLPQVPEETVARLGQVAKWLANAAIKLFGASGVSITGPTGGVAGQNAPHAIIHIIPRYPQDNIGLILQRQQVPAAELQKLRQGLAPKIKAEFGYDINGAEPPKKEQPKEPESTKGEAKEEPKHEDKPAAQENPEQADQSEEAQEGEASLDDITKMLGGEQ